MKFSSSVVRHGFSALLLLLLMLSGAVAQQDAQSPPASNRPETAQSTQKPAEGDSSVQSERPDLTPDAQGKLSQEQMQTLFRFAADKDIENDKKQRDYTYVEREVQHNLDGKGGTKSTEIKTFEILEIYGEQVQRLIEKDDKPLERKEADKEEEKIQKIIDKRKNESADDRKKRDEKQAKEREDGRKFVKEVADAYNFKLVGTEQINGREAWVIDGEPRPGFVPHMKESKFLSKLRGRVWVDKEDMQVARMSVETLDTVSFGLVLARIHKGTRFMLEQTRVNDEVWLPKLVTYKFDARVALLKGYNVDGEQTYRDYKKFRTSSKILGMAELKEQK